MREVRSVKVAKCQSVNVSKCQVPQDSWHLTPRQRDTLTH